MWSFSFISMYYFFKLHPLKPQKNHISLPLVSPDSQPAHSALIFSLAVEFRMTNFTGSFTSFGNSLLAISDSNILHDSFPISTKGCATVVSAGDNNAEFFKSAKPIMDKSSGIFIFKLCAIFIIFIANGSLAQNIALGLCFFKKILQDFVLLQKFHSYSPKNKPHLFLH